MAQDGSDVIDKLLANKKRGRIWTFIWVGIFCLISVGIVGVLTFNNDNRSITIAYNPDNYSSNFYPTQPRVAINPSAMPPDVDGIQKNKILMERVMKLQDDSLALALKNSEQIETLDSLTNQYQSIVALYEQKINNIQANTDNSVLDKSLNTLKRRSGATIIMAQRLKQAQPSITIK